MTERPILFSAPMVIALLQGRKTQTRRLAARRAQNVEIGDVLWVREKLQWFGSSRGYTTQYAATLTAVPHRGLVPGTPDGRAFWKWKQKAIPAIHCPRWASRITLRVTDVRRQRLHEITEKDAMDEGVEPIVVPSDRPLATPYRSGFCKLWRTLHGEAAWLYNPEVVALTFDMKRENVDELVLAELGARNDLPPGLPVEDAGP